MPDRQDIAAILARLNTSIQPEIQPATLHNIVRFNVTSDSVVATARVVTGASARRIAIGWGDGTSDTHAAIPVGTTAELPDSIAPLPRGHYEFHHAYEASEDKRPFRRSVAVRVEDRDGTIEFQSQDVLLTPRYRARHHTASVRLLSQCDSSAEKRNEFTIRLTVGGELLNQWKWKPLNYGIFPGVFFPLEGSAFTRELTADNRNTTVVYSFVESDWLFDDLLAAYTSLSIDDETELIEAILQSHSSIVGQGGCKLLLRFDREVSLVVPFPAWTGGAFAPL